MGLMLISGLQASLMDMLGSSPSPPHELANVVLGTWRSGIMNPFPESALTVLSAFVVWSLSRRRPGRARW
jgi:hypothetical protein